MMKNAIRSKLTTEYVPPVRIVAKSDSVTGEEFLLTNRFTQIFTKEKDCMRCKGKGYLILDFGAELCGGVRFLTYRVLPDLIGRVRIRFGESVGEACAEIGEKNATCHHSVRDMTVQIPNLSDQEWGRTGFRFVRIDFLDEQEYSFVNVYASFTYRDLEFKGDFECDDELVNEIYRTARRTVFLNMQENLWEGVKRDRLVWVGDMQPEVLAITDLFGANDCVEDAVALSVEKNPLPCWFGEIPTYSFWLIQILHDYYLKTGNAAFVEKYLGYVDGVLAQLDACVTENGKIDYSRCAEAGAREGFFLDWPTVGTQDAPAGNRYTFLFVIENLKKLYAALGKEENALCDRLLKKLRVNAEQEASAKQIVALGYLSGCLNKDTASRRLTQGGAKGLSTFMSYFILRAISETDNVSSSLEIMKEYYGGMLSRGATSFWEDFDVEWLDGSGRIDELPEEGKKDLHGDYGKFCYRGYRHSLCHGWSCGPVPFLTEKVLGITVLEAGCRAISVKPDLGNLKWCKGAFPTPYGQVEVFCEKRDGKTVTRVRAPEEVRIERA